MVDNMALFYLTTFRAFLVFSILMGVERSSPCTDLGILCLLLIVGSTPTNLLSLCLHAFFPLYFLLFKNVEKTSLEEMEKK